MPTVHIQLLFNCWIFFQLVSYYLYKLRSYDAVKSVYFLYYSMYTHTIKCIGTNQEYAIQMSKCEFSNCISYRLQLSMLSILLYQFYVDCDQLQFILYWHTIEEWYLGFLWRIIGTVKRMQLETRWDCEIDKCTLVFFFI